jgi:hypothetical protein
MVGISGFAGIFGEEDEVGDFFGFGEGDGGDDVTGGGVVAPFWGDEEIRGGGEDFLAADVEAVAKGEEGEALAGGEGGIGPRRGGGAKGGRKAGGG